MKRVKPEIRTARINVLETLKTIEKDLKTNQEELVNRKEYYTTKYRGDNLNDVNVGIFLNDDLETVVQVYVSNGFTSIRKRFILSKDNRTIVSETVTESKKIKFEKLIKVYDGKKLNDKVVELKKEFNETFPQFEIKEVLIHYPVDGQNYLIELEVL